MLIILTKFYLGSSFFALGVSVFADLVHISDLSQFQVADLSLQAPISSKDEMLLRYKPRSHANRSLSLRLGQREEDINIMATNRSASSGQLSQQEADIRAKCVIEIHFGTKSFNHPMELYVVKRYNHGIYLFNLVKTWAKLWLSVRVIAAIANPWDISMQLVRSVKWVPAMISHQPLLTHSRDGPEEPSPRVGNLRLHINDAYTGNWLQDQLMSPTWMCSLPIQKPLRLVFPTTFSGLKADKHFGSFKERDISYFSSLWERSFPPASSDTERTFPSSLYSSFIEETFGVQPQTLPLLVDTILAGFKTRFSSNSTKFEPTFQSDSITNVMLHRSDEMHIDFYKILRVCQDLKKCFTSIFALCFNHCISWVICFNRMVFGLIIVCIWNV